MQSGALLLIEVDDIVRQFEHLLGPDPEGPEVELDVQECSLHLFTKSTSDQTAVWIGAPLPGEEYHTARRRYDNVAVDRRWVEDARGIEVLELSHR